MRIKSYFLTASLCCILPFMVQGTDLDDVSPPTGPRAALRSVAPVIVETESGMLNLYFISDLDEVYVCLQEVTGAAEYNLPVDTSVQVHAELTAPAGTYILAILDTTGNVIHQENVFIP